MIKPNIVIDNRFCPFCKGTRYHMGEDIIPTNPLLECIKCNNKTLFRDLLTDGEWLNIKRTELIDKML